MAKSVYSKNIRRTIFGSFGRYIAILAIIALGVGFFTGVKNTKACMMETCNKYVTDHNMYDYRLVSTYGFEEKDVEALAAVDQVECAEGSITVDFYSVNNDGDSVVMRAHSLPEKINTVDLIEGRMPRSSDECIADDQRYGASDIGKTIKITDENNEETKDSFEYEEYMIVGIAKSPYYLTKGERGTTALGRGSVSAFVYVPAESLTSEYYTELFVKCKAQGFIFSDEYYANMERAEAPVTAAAETKAQERYDEIVGEAGDELEEGRKELEDGRNKLESEKAKANAQLKDAKRTLDEKKSELADGKAQLAEKKAEMIEQRETAVSGLAQAQAGLTQTQSSLDAAKQDPNTPAEVIMSLEAQIVQLQAAVTQTEAGIDQIDTGLAEIAKQEKQIKNGESQISDGYDEYYDSRAKAKSEFDKAEAELADGEAELAEAEEEINDLEKPEIYVYDREDNLGFGSFESNSDIVDSIAKVFPVFFFLIAALVCSTTMSRMIEEERTQIGALRAIGYTSGRIMLKYMIYSGSAALIGCVLGFLLGSKFFPMALWFAYGMMFGFAPLEYYFSLPLALISLAVALLCSIGTTYLACRGQLKNMPAEILRPRAPKAGKRVLLERVGFIWNRLKFLHKVTIRNIFRYKKRMIMMIVGIGGCTALVTAGFGIDDSIAGIGDHQYLGIQKYDVTVVFSEEVDEEQRETFETDFADEIESSALVQMTSVTLSSDKATKPANLVVTDDANITRAINFRLEDKKVTYPEEGEAVLNNKMAEMLGVKIGDSFEIEYDDSERVTVTLSGIYTNYVGNYIYINDDTYNNIMEKDYEPSMMYVMVKEGIEPSVAAESFTGYEDIIAISVTEDQRAGVDDMMASLDYVIALVIACAGALAFIVLFNLSNINITEREREIATIEVLGFYPRELGSYVFRENFILVIMGIIAGLPTGYALHKFIMARIIVDDVSFNRIIEPASYLYTVITVICFALIVDIIMRRKLRKIKMAEALKSIE